MRLKVDWQHVGALLLTLAPVALHLLQVLAPSWYLDVTTVAGALWLVTTKSVLADPGVTGK